jgi:hypothetical protein
MLWWETRPRLIRSDSALVKARARRADLRFVLRFGQLLSHDVAVGAQRYPELVQELHLVRPAEEETVARLALGTEMDPIWYPNLVFEPAIAQNLPGIIASLADGEWLEPAPGKPDLVMLPGPLARRLSHWDLIG